MGLKTGLWAGMVWAWSGSWAGPDLGAGGMMGPPLGEEGTRGLGTAAVGTNWGAHLGSSWGQISGQSRGVKEDEGSTYYDLPRAALGVKRKLCPCTIDV